LLILSLFLIGTIFQRGILLHSLPSDTAVSTEVSDLAKQTDITQITLYYCGLYYDGTLYARETTLDSTGKVTTTLRAGEDLTLSSSQEYLLPESSFYTLADNLTEGGYDLLPASSDTSTDAITEGYYIYIIVTTQTSTYRRGGYEADQRSETFASLCKMITDTTKLPLFVSD
jgi:hypothetical protein